MNDGLRTREKIFEELMKKDDNKKNWEMLCGSQKPLIPFIGAGVSAWCYSTWRSLLIEIVEKTYSPECADIVKNALGGFFNRGCRSTKKTGPLKALGSKKEQFVRYDTALQIWRILDFSEECPLIAITGEVGSGKSTLCRSIQKLQEGSRNTMQFLFISLKDCKRWHDFCIRIYEELNIMEFDIPPLEQWKEFAKKVSDRCVVYWRSVLVLDHLDGLRNENEDKNVWKTIKEVLIYWKKHRTRVIFITSRHPDGIPCYTWHMEKLAETEAAEVFFNFCSQGQSREMTYLEKKVVGELFSRQSFRPMSLELLGRYANSKNDLTSLLEEWKFYHKPGNTCEQTLAWILWEHLLSEHQYKGTDTNADKNIRKNILWVWDILGSYPGVCPSEFFESFYKTPNKEPYQDQALTEKTLIYLKNVGLCEERESEEEQRLLENMVNCVRNYFIEFVDQKLPQNNIKTEFEKTIDNNKKMNYGLNCFRGYYMHSWENDLRVYICGQLSKEEKQPLFLRDSTQNVLDFLEKLGELVKSSEQRAKNRSLDLVLNYEIKTVSRFLYSCLLDSGKNEERTVAIINIADSFSHYFHYLPNYSVALIRLILDIMEKSMETNGTYKDQFCMFARMHQVMGDVQRFMGKKGEAVRHYQKAIEFCNRQLMKDLETKKEPSESKRCLRIKADVLMTRSYFKEEMKEEDKKELEESFRISKKLKDAWGAAYFNHRKGERLYAEITESTIELNKIKDNEVKKEKEALFDKIFTHYNEALVFYQMDGLLSKVSAPVSDTTGRHYEKHGRFVLPESKGI